MTKAKPPKRVGSSILIAVTIVAVLATLAPAAAAPLPIVAGPGNLYLSRPAVTRQGTPVNFVNLDIMQHDVVSLIPGLFFSNRVGVGKKSPVFGVQSLPKGTYRFYCTLHPFMTANLRVI